MQNYRAKLPTYAIDSGVISTEMHYTFEYIPEGSIYKPGCTFSFSVSTSDSRDALGVTVFANVPPPPGQVFRGPNTVHRFSSFVDVMESLDGHKLVIDKEFAANRIKEHLDKIEKLKADYGIN